MNRLSKFLALLTLLVISVALFRSIVITNAADPRAGVNIDPLNPSASPTVAQLQAAGVKWVRFVHKSDSYDYASLVRSFSNVGIQTVMVLNQETLWPPTGNGNFDDGYLVNFPKKASTLAQKYGNTVAAYEIWNEPDAGSAASIYVPPEKYKLLFKRTYEAIKSVNSSRSVIIGGLVSGNLGYLDALKESNGTLLADGVGVHPYATDATSVVTTLERYQERAAGKRIWVTEFGWETTQNNGQVQANFLGAVYSAIYTNSKLATIPNVIWYGWSDAMGGRPFGLLSISGVAKPSLTAYLLYASKMAAPNDTAQLAKLIAQIQLVSLPPGSTNGNGSTATKLGVFVHGQVNTEASTIIAARPKVLKLMYGGSNPTAELDEAKKFKQQNPNGITILRYFDWVHGNADLAQMDPTAAAEKSFEEYFGSLRNHDLSSIDYFETPNESERINHWGSHEKDPAKAAAEVEWQNTFWSHLIDLNYNQLNKLKTCAGSLTPGYLKPEHVPLLETMFSKLRQSGGALCYHSYADGDIFDTSGGSNTFWYKNFYSSPEFNGVPIILSEIGIADGWKSRGMADMQKFLMTVDCEVAKDPRVLGTAIYEVGTDASSVYDINNTELAGWIAGYLQSPSSFNSTVPACSGVVISPEQPPIPQTPGTPPAACNPAGEGTIAVAGPSCGPSDPTNPVDPKTHPDINVKLRGFLAQDGSDRGLVDFRGKFGLDIDPKSPNVNDLFEGGDYPAVVNSYKVGDWTGKVWADDPWLNATAFQVTPGEALHVPDSGYEIGCGYEVMVLYADDNSLFIKYTLEDNAIAGYGIHLLGIKPTPKIKDLYDKMNAAGRKNLPALKPNEVLGTAINNAVLVVYRDTGAFLDPRSCVDHWPGCPKDGFPDTPLPTVTRAEANNLFSNPSNPAYWQRNATFPKRANPNAACDLLSLEQETIYPPLGSLQACPPEFPTVGKINSPPAPTPNTPSPTGGCSIQPIAEPAYCTSAVAACSDKNDEKNGSICPNGIRESCFPDSCNMLRDSGFTCGETRTRADGTCEDVNGRAGATHAQCGIFIRKACDGEGYDPNNPPEDDANRALFDMWQAAQSCYRGDGSLNYETMAPNAKSTIGRCLTYYAKKGVSKTTPTPPATLNPQYIAQNLTLPSCVPTQSKTPDRCTSSCGDPITLNERLGFTVTEDCATGQCKATIKIDPTTPLTVPFARKLADYFAGVLDYGAIAEGTLTSEELLKVREEVKAGDSSGINAMFAKSGVAKKLLPARIQDQLRCQFVNYVKEKDKLWGTPLQQNTKYIYLHDGKKEIFKIHSTPITEVTPPPYLDPVSCKYSGAVYDAVLTKWKNEPSGKLWMDIPLFDNEDSQSKIEFVGAGVFTNSLNPIQTSVPEIRRLYNVTSVIQRALIPDYDLAEIAQPVNPTPKGAPLPQDLKLTIGPELNPGKMLFACSPTPTPTLDVLFGNYDNDPKNTKYALEPTISSYKLGVDCVQQGVPQDLTTTSKVCTVGPEGQLNCFQQLPREDNVITKEFRAVAQSRNVTPYLYDVFLHTIENSGGFLRIFKPSYLEKNGTGLEARDEFQQYYQPYPAESNKIKYQMPTTQGVQLDESGNAGGWKMLFDKLGGVWTAQQFVIDILRPNGVKSPNTDATQSAIPTQ